MSPIAARARSPRSCLGNATEESPQPLITISTRPLESVQVTADRMHETHAELTAEWTGEAHGGKAAPRDLEPAETNGQTTPGTKRIHVHGH